MAEIHEGRIDESKLDTVLAEDVHFEGTANFTKELMIKGRYKGKIESAGNVYVASIADVEADIFATEVHVRGRVKGHISARVRVELLDKAEVIGNITAPKITMDVGCRFDGISKMENIEETEATV